MVAVVDVGLKTSREEVDHDLGVEELGNPLELPSRPQSSMQRRTTSTFSCDIARRVSAPAELGATDTPSLADRLGC